ncbi:hypothetical protein KR009_006877 [Drosophila setifemur]|nr:hypothetical protein KR009_006877 [Drosophila setifemur]
MPYFVMCSYFMDLVYSLVNIERVGKERAIVLDVDMVFGYIYTIFDLILMVSAIFIVIWTRKEDSGVTLILIGRVIHRMLFSLGTLYFYFLLDDSLDVGSLLFLLARKTQQREKNDCNQMERRKYQLLLLAGRLCLCTLFITWLDEQMDFIFNIVTVFLLSFTVLGLQCQLFAYLTVFALLYHDVFSNHWSMLFGWNDTLLSLQYFSILLSKIGGFVLLSELGGGKWSIDGYRTETGERWPQTGGYRIIKSQTPA